MPKTVNLSDEVTKHLDKIRSKFSCSYSEAIKKLLLASGYQWSEENLLKAEIWRLFAVLGQYMPGDTKVLNALRDLLIAYAFVPTSVRAQAEKLIVEHSNKLKKKIEVISCRDRESSETRER